MAEDLQHRLAMAAAAGMLAGLVACSESPPPTDPSGLDGPTANPVGQTDGDAPDATDVAAGDKGCCGPGTNACEGKGACATDANACAGKNACEGKGGCYAKDCAKEDSRAAKQAAASPAEPPVPDDAPEGEAPRVNEPIATTARPRPIRSGWPYLGCGIGLRKQHYLELFRDRPAIDFLEVISENFMVAGGPPLANLDRARELCPLVQHGVSLGIGAVTPLDFDYLAKLKTLTRRTGTPWVTDHLCWTRAGGVDLHDLLPLPHTEEAVRHVAERLRVAQDFLELPVGIENVSSYLAYECSTMSEATFLAAVVEEADCAILLDVNNVYVSAFNHGFDARGFLDAIPAERVLQIHLAGHTHRGDYILDTHDDVVIDEVWGLYRHAITRMGAVSTLVEWDSRIPALEVVWNEAKKAAAIIEEVALAVA